MARKKRIRKRQARKETKLKKTNVKARYLLVGVIGYILSELAMDAFSIKEKCSNFHKWGICGELFKTKKSNSLITNTLPFQKVVSPGIEPGSKV